ncbi:uncharacterized protein LOC104453401 [Eucalyptus grandis]|uniref:uncharacterized protein LOC104453401 n=1 Tax=Eucalyptus grandis TaxID=71139 RepID=UPI00192EEA28|nr:uncharacterized protein LOC104453401 [Eucalyptus grandis]
MQLYMDRNETARAVESHTGIDRQMTQMVWDRLEEQNPVFFQQYYIRVVLKQQILRFNQLLEQQHRAMNFPPVPAKQQMSMELAAETAPHNGDSPLSVMNFENEADSDKLPAIPAGSVGLGEVAGSAPHLVPGGSLPRSSLEAQGMRINAALDSAQRPISQVPNLTAGGHHAGNIRGPFQPSTSMAQSLSCFDINLEASVQEALANLALDQGPPSVDL